VPSSCSSPASARGPRQSESSASTVRIAAARRRRRGSGARAEESLGGNISRHLHRKMPTFLDKITPRGASLLPNSHHVATGREGSSDSYPRCSAQCGGLRSSDGRRAGPRPCISAPSRSLWGSGSLPTAAQAHPHPRRSRRDLPTAVEASTAPLAHDAFSPGP